MTYCVVITPDSEVRIEGLPEAQELHHFTRPILGGMMEVVRPVRLQRPYLMVVDESGLYHGHPMNPFASFLYGTDCHGQPIVGNAIVLKEDYTEDGEPDLFGLEHSEALEIFDTFQRYIRAGHAIGALAFKQDTVNLNLPAEC